MTNTGLHDIEDAIKDPTAHLLIKGIEHEHTSGRATLPRVMQVWIDKDEKGRDKLKLENIKERLKAQNLKGLHLADFEAVSSKDNYFIQIVDLFTGAVNRKLHPQEAANHKDEFADIILNLVGLDPNEIERGNTDVDNSALFNLR